jgi:hypothetical protein
MAAIAHIPAPVTALIYTPRSGSRIVAYKPSASCCAARFPNNSFFAWGGAGMVPIEIGTSGGQNRRDVAQIVRAFLGEAGGVVWDINATIHAIVSIPAAVMIDRALWALHDRCSVKITPELILAAGAEVTVSPCGDARLDWGDEPHKREVAALDPADLRCARFVGAWRKWGEPTLLREPIGVFASNGRVWLPSWPADALASLCASLGREAEERREAERAEEEAEAERLARWEMGREAMLRAEAELVGEV